MKTNDDYCFAIPVDIHTVLEVDYMVSGVNPEEVVMVAKQDGITMETKKEAKAAEVRLEAMSAGYIDLCWKKLDSKTKKLDFDVKRNMAHSEEKADADTLDSLSKDLELL